MPPTDSTPNLPNSNFKLLHSLKAYNKIPIREYKSNRTGLTVVIAEVDGPVVNGYFCLVTEAFDDDGLPHTLEHLIFLGSEDYPYKGVLDLLANRCLASGTNAWTDIDHTCYTMETAGSEGFLTLMPIYLDHILYPKLTEEGFVTEVHHVTAEGDDAGIVYCEMQGRENSADSKLYLSMARNLYPGKCGYSSETGGIMKNLRESTSNEKVRNYHKEFYRPENLKLIITGQVAAEDVFKALERLEDKILSKGDRGKFDRPWQNTVPPYETSKELIYQFPSDEEKNGIFGMSWRGPSAVTEQYTLSAVMMLMKYLCHLSISPLQKEFIEIPDPYASKVSHNISENSEACLFFIFQNVPKDKLPLVKPKLEELLRRLVMEEDIDMEQLKNVIDRYKQESLSNIENSPHHAVAFMIIGFMLYGNTKEDLEQRVNPLVDFEKLLKEPKEFWVNLLRKYFVENNSLALQGVPSIEEQKRLREQEKARVEQQIATLGADGLKQKGETLEKAIEFNERPAPVTMLQSVPVPSIKSIKFHDIVRYSSAQATDKVDLTKSPVYTYFDHINSNFVYIFALLDTSNLPLALRPYLPLLLDTIFESPVKRGEKIIPRQQIITELNIDMVSFCGSLGLGGSKASSFKCGTYSHTAVVMLQVESSKYSKGVSWLRELLYETIMDVEVLSIIANKMSNNVAEAKRSGRNVVNYAYKGLNYVKDSNVRANGILKQEAFLADLIIQLKTNSEEALCTFEKVRAHITDPSNLSLYLAGNLELIKNLEGEIENFFPERLNKLQVQKPINVTPDYKLIVDKPELPSCIIGLGAIESSYMVQTTPSINDYKDPDLPALLLYVQYLIQAEGPLWKQVRGKGYSYGYTISLKVNEGLLCLLFAKASNVFGAYRETYNTVTKQLSDKEWDETLLESAKSSLVFELIDEEKTIGGVVSVSLSSYFEGVDYTFKRSLLGVINNLTVEDLNRVGEKYVAPLFDPRKTKTAIVCDPAKTEELRQSFENMDIKLKLYPTLEESFLKDLA